MGIPLSMADVASVLRNLCGWTRGRFSLFPSSRSRLSTPPICKRSCGAVSETNNAEQVSVRLSRIVLEMDFCPGIEINDPFLTSFSENNALSLIEVDVIAVEGNHLTNTHSGGCEKVNHSEIADIAAVVPHDFQCLIGVGFLDHLCRFYFVNPAYRTFHDVVLILKPRKVSWTGCGGYYLS